MNPLVDHALHDVLCVKVPVPFQLVEAEALERKTR
jgi:hypothetical protein